MAESHKPICTACARQHFDMTDPGRPPDPIAWHVCAWCGQRTAWGLMMPKESEPDYDPDPYTPASTRVRDTRTGPHG